ncbi:MAG: hypothetical protein H7Y37_01265 [Anaerolineae bacterium]|nr:hypothetical protein [Gloeobacterales cyanobacterium ES-bin-313]
MNRRVEAESFVDLVRQLAHIVEPVLEVEQEGNNFCSIQYPGIGDKLWVKVFYRDGEALYQIFKNRLKEAKSLHHDEINPVKKEYLLGFCASI